MTKRRVSVALIEVKNGRKTITPESLEVYRKGHVAWVIVNKDLSGSLNVGISGFYTPVPHSPPPLMDLLVAVDVPAGEFRVISEDVNPTGNGKIPYQYNVLVDGFTIDPEIVVCDDPEKDPTARKKAAKKAAKKRTSKK